MESFERGALAIDELPDDAEPAVPEVEVEQTAGLRISPLAWVLIAIVVLAVVIF